MKKLSREKIALIIFGLLVMFGLGTLMFYITGIGHSFNGVASTIDDATGDLDDYTAIVYAGTAEKKKALNEAGLESILPLAQSPAESDTENSTSQGISKTLELGTDQAISVNNESEEAVASDIALHSKSADSSSEEGQEASEPITVSQVRDSFLRKHASVYQLDLANPTIYIEPTIVKAGKYRFGILAVDAASALPAYINSRIKLYQAADVDFVIAVVDDLSRLTDTDGIDIIISTQEEGLKPVGVSSDGVFFNDAPLVGEVGALLISPSRSISAKDISEL